jgi:hypothetical protein
MCSEILFSNLQAKGHLRKKPPVKSYAGFEYDPGWYKPAYQKYTWVVKYLQLHLVAACRSRATLGSEAPDIEL